MNGAEMAIITITGILMIRVRRILSPKELIELGHPERFVAHNILNDNQGNESRVLIFLSNRSRLGDEKSWHDIQLLNIDRAQNQDHRPLDPEWKFLAPHRSALFWKLFHSGVASLGR